jgi:hypothetical protein
VPGDVVEIRIEVAGQDDPVRDERAARLLRDDRSDRGAGGEHAQPDPAEDVLGG